MHMCMRIHFYGEGEAAKIANELTDVLSLTRVSLVYVFASSGQARPWVATACIWSMRECESICREGSEWLWLCCRFYLHFSCQVSKGRVHSSSWAYFYADMCRQRKESLGWGGRSVNLWTSYDYDPNRLYLLIEIALSASHRGWCYIRCLVATQLSWSWRHVFFFGGEYSACNELLCWVTRGSSWMRQGALKEMVGRRVLKHLGSHGAGWFWSPFFSSAIYITRLEKRGKEEEEEEEEEEELEDLCSWWWTRQHIGNILSPLIPVREAFFPPAKNMGEKGRL